MNERTGAGSVTAAEGAIIKNSYQEQADEEKRQQDEPIGNYRTGVDNNLQGCIRKSLQKVPENRYSDIGVFIDELKSIQEKYLQGDLRRQRNETQPRHIKMFLRV